MFIDLPNVGWTDSEDLLIKISKYKDSITKASFIMCGYGYEEKTLPSEWYSIENAEQLLDYITSINYISGHENPTYLGFVILTLKNPIDNEEPFFITSQIRMCSTEGVPVLRILKKYEIPVTTQGIFPYEYHKLNLDDELKFDEGFSGRGIKNWKQKDWYNYCLFITNKC